MKVPIFSILILILIMVPAAALGRVDVQITGPAAGTSVILVPLDRQGSEISVTPDPDGSRALNIPAGEYVVIFSSPKTIQKRHFMVRDGTYQALRFQSFACQGPGAGRSCQRVT